MGEGAMICFNPLCLDALPAARHVYDGESYCSFSCVVTIWMAEERMGCAGRMAWVPAWKDRLKAWWY